MTKGSIGRSWNGCSPSANILSLRSLNWRIIKILDVRWGYRQLAGVKWQFGKETNGKTISTQVLEFIEVECQA
jgi:hypothetical protein